MIGNAAREPEIGDLGRCLIAMGAKIAGLGTAELTVEGVSRLHGAEHRVMPDRIEAGTYAIAAAMPAAMSNWWAPCANTIAALLERAGAERGVDAHDTENGMQLQMNGGRPIRADVTTAPFPGFPTDLQAQFMALMTVADGTSTIREKIFENRFMHVPELARMGADIRVEGDTAIVRGVEKLKGAPVMATDLRARVSLVLAGLAAEGETHRQPRLSSGPRFRPAGGKARPGGRRYRADSGMSGLVKLSGGRCRGSRDHLGARCRTRWAGSRISSGCPKSAASRMLLNRFQWEERQGQWHAGARGLAFRRRHEGPIAQCQARRARGDHLAAGDPLYTQRAATIRAG